MFGSLLIPFCRMICLVLQYIEYKFQNTSSCILKSVLSIFKLMLCCLENLFKLLSENAYIMCAIYGKSFCRSALDALNLIMRNCFLASAINTVTAVLFFAMKIATTLGIGSIAFLYFDCINYELHYQWMPIISVMCGAYFVADLVFDIYSIAVDTLFLCFCMNIYLEFVSIKINFLSFAVDDYERNDGSPGKPYFMPKDLMKIIGKQNKV